MSEIRPIDTVPESVDGTYEVHFGDVRYLVILTPEPIKAPGVGEDDWGCTENLFRRITVRTAEDDQRLAVDFVQDTLIHELLHAAMHISGHQPGSDAYDEETVVSILSRPLLRLFADPRNRGVMSLLFPPPILQIPRDLERQGVGHVAVKDTLWQIPDEPKFARFDRVDLGPYIEKFNEQVSDLAGLAAREAASAEEPLCMERSTSSGLYCEHPADHLTNDSGFSHTFTRPF